MTAGLELRGASCLEAPAGAPILPAASRRLQARALALIALLLPVALSAQPVADGGARPQRAPRVHVLCVGDSITAAGYPGLLQRLLGPGYRVRNMGHSGTTAVRGLRKSYPLAQPGLAAEIVLIMLGTNDAHPNIWPTAQARFEDDYRDLVRSYANLVSRPVVYVGLPPPVTTGNPGGFSEDNLAEVRRIIRRVAAVTGARVVDVERYTLGHAGYFPDGVHPSRPGSTLIAQAFHDAIVAVRGAAPGATFDAPGEYPETARAGLQKRERGQNGLFMEK